MGKYYVSIEVERRCEATFFLHMNQTKPMHLNLPHNTTLAYYTKTLTKSYTSSGQYYNHPKLYPYPHQMLSKNHHQSPYRPRGHAHFDVVGVVCIFSSVHYYYFLNHEPPRRWCQVLIGGWLLSWFYMTIPIVVVLYAICYMLSAEDFQHRAYMQALQFIGLKR